MEDPTAISSKQATSMEDPSPPKTRMEHDLLGDEEVPADAYYGIQTLRAVRNFDITGVPISHFPQLIRSLAMVKKAAALANRELGHLPKKKSQAIVFACNEVIAGKWHDQFPVDLIQGGAGTSTNMNANEVIANRGLEILGKQKGEYHFLHPNNDVRFIPSVACLLAPLFPSSSAEH